MKLALLIYWIFAHGVIGQEQLYHQELIATPSGLYLEGMGPVKRIVGEWTVFTSIKLQNIYLQSEPLTPLLLRVLTQIKGDESSNLLQYISVLKNEDDINMKQWQNFRDYIRPFGSDIRMNHTNYSSISTEEIDSLYDSLIFAERTNNASDRERKTTYIASGLEDIMTELEILNIQLTQILQIFANDQATFQAKEDANNRIHAILTAIIKTRTKLFSSIMEVIMSATLGLIHPLVFEQKQLRNILDELAQEDLGFTLPVPEEGLALLQLKDIMNWQLTIKNGRIMFIAKLPLIKNLSDKICRVHSHPVFQNIFPEVGIFARVVPSADYLWLTNDNRTYSVFQKNFLVESCKKVNNLLICKSPTTLSVVTQDSPCEVAIYFNSNNNTLPSCQIEIVQVSKNLWIPLDRPSSWLYSFSSTEIAEIKCPFFPTVTTNIRGNGRIDLKKGCTLMTQNTTLVSDSEIKLPPQISDVILQKHLKVELLFPEVKQFESQLIASPITNVNHLRSLINLTRNLTQKNYISTQEFHIEEPSIVWKILIIFNACLILYSFISRRIIQFILNPQISNTNNSNDCAVESTDSEKMNQVEKPESHVGKSSVHPTSDIPLKFTFSPFNPIPENTTRAIVHPEGHYSLPRPARPYTPLPSTSRAGLEEPLFAGEEENIYIVVE